MITLVTGKSGSGKSYKVVNDIVQLLNTRKVITNIQLLNFSHPNYIYKNEGELKEYILMITKLFDNVSDLPSLVSDLSHRDFFDVDFYIDECHLVGFRKRMEGLINWLSVRRHLNQNITLITQTLKKIHGDYIPDIHLHTIMVPQNKRPNKEMIGWKTYDEVGGDRIETSYVFPNKDLFEIYKSGKKEGVRNIAVVKLLGWLSFLLAVIFGLGFILTTGFGKVYNDDGSAPFTNLVKIKDSNITSSVLENNQTDFYNTSVDCNLYVSKPMNWILAQKIGSSWYCCILINEDYQRTKQQLQDTLLMKG